MKIGYCENVARVGTPADVGETGRALVDLALPFGILEREHLHNVPLAQTAQDELGVVGPLEVVNCVEAVENVDDLEGNGVSDDQSELNCVCLKYNKL
jgi:hypothetical protein